MPVEYCVEIAVATGEKGARIGQRVGDLVLRQRHDPFEDGFETRRAISIDLVPWHEQLGDHSTRIGNEAHRPLSLDRECIHENPRPLAIVLPSR